MKALVRAELVKVRSTRTPVWLLLATQAVMVLAIAVNVPTGQGTNSTFSIRDPDLLARIIADTFGVPEVTMVLLGVLAITQEFRYGTITATFLVEPRRHRVLTAKAIALVFTSVVVAAVSLAVSLLAGITVIRLRNGETTLGPELWQVAVAAFAAMALYGIIGLAVGALLRNQIIAVVVALIWMLAVEHLLIEALPEVGKWTMGGATSALLQLDPVATTHASLLDAPIGGLLLIGYTAAVAAVALVITPRRDVL